MARYGRVGLNFNNILCTAFTLVDPESIKNTVKSFVSFTLSGSTGAKAAHRTLMKLTPEGWVETVMWVQASSRQGYFWELKKIVIFLFHF
jgi:hypothetical protein